MKKVSLTMVVLLGLTLGAGVFAVEATGPPKAVPYRRIADPADDAERHIVVKADDRGPVWLLTGFLHLSSDIAKGLTYETSARVKPKHMRSEFWPFLNPATQKTGSAVTLGKCLDTILRLRESGMTWQVVLHAKGRYSGRRWHSFVDTATEAQLKDYYDHIYTLVKYCRNMGLPVDYWEVTNEPAGPQHTEEDKGGYFKHSWQDMLDFWDTNYDAIRAANPDAKIVGPSFGGSDPEEMEAFLAHCKEKGQKVDILSWHNNCYRRGPNGSYRDEVDYVQKNINEMREMVETKFPMVGVEAYHLDETGYYLPQTGMGAHIAYFYYMDLAGLDRAAKTGPPYMMSATRISPDTPRAVYWAWVDYAKQDGGLRLVTETDDRNLVCLASRHDEGKIVRALVARAKKQAMADPPESAPNWKAGSQAPAKPPVAAKIDFEGIPLSDKAEVTILRLPPGHGPLYEDDLEALTATTMMNVTGGKLTIELADVIEDNAFSIVIGPEGTREKERAEAAKWAKTKPKKRAEKGEREVHREATAKAAQAAKEGAIRVNCASFLAHTDPEGNGWFADRPYTPGEWGYPSGEASSPARRDRDISGTTNPEIYCTERWAMSGYKFTVANGSYLVRLHFAETYGANRKFDITIEDETVLKDFNPLKEAGGRNKAFFREFTTDVADGALDVGFVGLGIIDAIEAIRQ